MFYNRLFVKDTILHSLSHTRRGKCNSYTIRDIFNGDEKFGYVTFFAENVINCKSEMTQCPHKTFLAFITRMDACTPVLSQFPGLNNLMDVKMKYIHEFKLTGFIDVINVNNTVGLCLDVSFSNNVDDVHFG